VKARVILLIFGMVLVATLVSGYFLFSYLVPYFSYNKYEDAAEVSSPGGKYIAFGCHLVGGATTTDSTFVQIRLKGESRDYQKNEVLFMVDNLGPFKISWVNDNELKIGYTKGPIYVQKSQWRDVRTTYAELNESPAQ
jgi:hypothetical protein